MIAAVTEAVGAMRVRDVAEPGEPGEGEVLVRPTAVGICGSDFHFFEGRLSEHAGGSGFPRIQGHEVAATVEAVGPGCRAGIEVGRTVALFPLTACGHCYPCRIGRPNVCVNFSLIGIHEDGGLQELLRIAEHAGVPDRRHEPGGRRARRARLDRDARRAPGPHRRRRACGRARGGPDRTVAARRGAGSRSDRAARRPAGGPPRDRRAPSAPTPSSGRRRARSSRTRVRGAAARARRS